MKTDWRLRTWSAMDYWVELCWSDVRAVIRCQLLATCWIHDFFGAPRFMLAHDFMTFRCISWYFMVFHGAMPMHPIASHCIPLHPIASPVSSWPYYLAPRLHRSYRKPGCFPGPRSGDGHDGIKALQSSQRHNGTVLTLPNGELRICQCLHF